MYHRAPGPLASGQGFFTICYAICYVKTGMSPLKQKSSRIPLREMKIHGASFVEERVSVSVSRQEEEILTDCSQGQEGQRANSKSNLTLSHEKKFSQEPSLIRVRLVPRGRNLLHSKSHAVDGR